MNNQNIYIPSPSPHDPDEMGHFGKYGGRFVPETLMPALEKLRLDYEAVRFDTDFWSEVDYYYKNYVGRPSALYFAANISKELGAKIYLKREDLNHTGAHKINHCVAQTILAKRLGRKKKKENHSRDRCRTAWCGYCYSSCTAWAGV